MSKGIKEMIGSKLHIGNKKAVMVLWILIVFIVPQRLHAAPYGKGTEYELGIRAKEYMLARYGPVMDQAMVDRIGTIVQRIVRIADKRKGIDIDVTIIDCDEIGAWAFPGGFICITDALIYLCANNDELAVILGHEIAHEVKGHVDLPVEERVRRKYSELLREIGATGNGLVAEYSALDFTNEIRRQKEIEADQYGILYTALAGYDASAAFSILAKVMSSAEQAKGRPHLSLHERQQIIERRLQNILNSIEIFWAGVRFFGRGQYDEAIEAFTHFLNVFPSCEVYNNIGIAIHKKALQRRPQNQPIQAMKSLRIDSSTLAENIDLRGYRGLYNDLEFKQDINKAIQYYEQAIQQNPKYTTAYINLGCAFDDIGEYDYAALYFKIAMKHNRHRKDLFNNLGVVAMHQEDFNSALDYFIKAMKVDPKFGPALFNTALCYELKGKPSEAKEYYDRFLVSGHLSTKKWLKLGQSKFRKSKDSDSKQLKDKKLDFKLLSCIGQLCIGDSYKKLEHVAGEHDKEVVILPSKNVSAFVFPSHGITALVEKNQVINIAASDNFKGQLKPNIRLGNSVTEVLNRFGPFDIVESIGEDRVSYAYDSLRVRFEFQNDVLKEIDLY